MTLFLEVYPLQLNPEDTVVNCAERRDSVFAFALLSSYRGLLLGVGVAAGESLRCGSFYSLGNKSLEPVKGM